MDAEFAQNTWEKLAEKYNFEVGENGKVAGRSPVRLTADR